jgi:hypothetical protein
MPQRILFLMVLLGTLACNGEAEIGEECDTTGSTDECTDGAVCSEDTGGRRCRRVCKDDAACASSEECNGVSGTNIKSCQLKPK